MTETHAHPPPPNLVPQPQPGFQLPPVEGSMVALLAVLDRRGAQIGLLSLENQDLVGQLAQAQAKAAELERENAFMRTQLEDYRKRDELQAASQKEPTS